MLTFLRQYKTNHLFLQQSTDEIDNFTEKHIYRPSYVKTSVGDETGRVSNRGRAIGWVSDTLPPIFFAETVELEIAESHSIRRGNLTARDEDIRFARRLLNQLDIPKIADRSPFFLSEGETKMVWLLCQFAKFPEYMIIGHLPGKISEDKFYLILDLIMKADQLAGRQGCRPPLFLLGCIQDDIHLFETLLIRRNWKVTDEWIG